MPHVHTAEEREGVAILPIVRPLRHSATIAEGFPIAHIHAKIHRSLLYMNIDGLENA
jgi:hypothetical protein